MLLTGRLDAATLSVDDVAGVAAGDPCVAVTVRLTSALGERVSSMQMDIGFNASALTLNGVAAGTAATNAAKAASSSQLSPGVVRVLVAGMNQNVIANGSVVVLTFSVSRTAARGPYAVNLTQVQLASPYGWSVPVVAGTGYVYVSEEGEGEGEGEGEPPVGAPLDSSLLGGMTVVFFVILSMRVLKRT